MMKLHQTVQAGVLSLGLSLFASGKAEAFKLNFSAIATTGGQFSSYSSLGQGLGTDGGMSGYLLSFNANQKGLAINNNGGTVAYFGSLIEGGQGIFASTGVGAPKLIADTKPSSLFSSFGQGLSINKTGTVAFFATLKTGATGIYTSNGVGAPKLIASTDGIFSGFAPGLSINDKGEVAFYATLKSGGAEIFKSNGTILTNISHCVGAGTSANQCPLTGSELNTLTAQAPSINNAGMVAFVSTKGVFTGNENGINMIVSNPNAFANGSYREANISDNGQVSAWAHNNGPGQMLFSSNGTTGSVIAGNINTGGNNSFLHLGSSSINSKGNVAFMANQVDLGKGIFIGSDAVEDKVIGVGSALFGSKVTDLFFDREALSDDNEITFWAKLANGIEGIFRANKFADSQYNPWLPNCQGAAGATHGFCNVDGNAWFDPPSAYGFNYKMTSGSLFTSILDLPSNFTKPFSVRVGEILLGEFTAGDRVDFTNYADKLGALLVNGSGVSEFTVTGLNVDPTNPTVFPLKLAFDTDKASFDMYALENNNAEVPEPSSMVGLMTSGAILALAWHQRKRKQQPHPSQL